MHASAAPHPPSENERGVLHTPNPMYLHHQTERKASSAQIINMKKTRSIARLFLLALGSLSLSCAFQSVPSGTTRFRGGFHTRISDTRQQLQHEEVLSTESPTETTADSFYHLLHKGLTATFMNKWPSILTYTLVEGWTEDTTQAFRDAVDQVVKLNPLLAGKVYRHHPFPFSNYPELRVQPGFFLQDHDFVTVVDAPSDMSSPKGMNCTTALDLIEENIIPIANIHCESTGTDIAKQLPLFSAHVVRLKDNHACFAIKMSHCLGDGYTYYRIVDQILHMLNQKMDKDKESEVMPELINWDHPLKATHELYPDCFSERDIRNSYGWPFYVGLFRNFRRLINPGFSRLMVLHRDKINAVKNEYLKNLPYGTILSANDLITAGLCQSNDSADMFSFPLSLRGRKEGMEDQTAAGYLCHEIPFPKDAAMQPTGMRQIVSKQRYYDTDRVPIEPFLKGRGGRMTNLASVGSKYLYNGGPAGLKTLCHCFPSSFFEIFPIDVCVIFKMDAEHVGVIHNFDKYRQNDLLDSMTVFSLEPEKH